MTIELYVGVDSCHAAWFYTVISDGAILEADIASNVSLLWAKLNRADLILIDIPIGLAFNSGRGCDM